MADSCTGPTTGASLEYPGQTSFPLVDAMVRRMLDEQSPRMTMQAYLEETAFAVERVIDAVWPERPTRRGSRVRASGSGRTTWQAFLSAWFSDDEEASWSNLVALPKRNALRDDLRPTNRPRRAAPPPSEPTCMARLQVMADRLVAIGGTLRVSSVPGGGTTVEGRIPIRAEGVQHPGRATSRQTSTT